MCNASGINIMEETQVLVFFVITNPKLLNFALDFCIV